MNDNHASSTDGVRIERTFDAPIEVVWQMWTDPEHFKKWYGPTGFTVPVSEKDVRVGGKHLCCMASPDGSLKMWTTGEFVEVVPHERLVYTESPADENGNIVEAPEGFPGATQVTVILESLGAHTKMTMTHEGLPPNSQGANMGWNQAFDKMVDYLETAHVSK